MDITIDAEMWRPVVGYELDYEVSSHGRVRRIRRGPSNIATAGRILGGSRVVNGRFASQRYHKVGLVSGGKQKNHSVHRLVLIAFVGPPLPGKNLCAHYDGNPHNNHLSNLRWATAQENSADRIRHGRSLKGTKNPNSSLTQERIDAMRKAAALGVGYEIIAIIADIGRSTAGRILRGQTYKHDPRRRSFVPIPETRVV